MSALDLISQVTATIEPKRSYDEQIAEDFYKAVSAYAHKHALTAEKLHLVDKTDGSTIPACKILKGGTVIGDIVIYTYRDAGDDEISTYAFKAHKPNGFQLVKDGDYHQVSTIGDFNKKLRDFLQDLTFTKAR